MNLRAPTDYIGFFKTTTRSKWDVATPFALIGLSLIGVAFIYSAQFSTQRIVMPESLTVTKLGMSFTFTSPTMIGVFTMMRVYWFKQVVFLSLGAGVYTVVSLIDYRFWLSVVHWIYAACVLALVLVLIPGIGREVYGSRRWLFVFQPSETAKIGVLLITASILVRSKIGSVSRSLGVLGKLALAVGTPLLLILAQPDLKSAIVLPPMVFSMLYVSKLSVRFFVGALGVFLLIVGAVVWDSYRYLQFLENVRMQKTTVKLVTSLGREPTGAELAGEMKLPESEIAQLKSHHYRDGDKYSSWLPLRDYQRNRILPFVRPDKVDPMGIAWNQRQSLISVGSGGLTGKGWTEGTQAQLGYLPRAVAHNDFIFSVIAEEKGFLGSITVLGLFGLVLFNGIRIAGLARDRLGTLLAIGVTVLFLVHIFVNIAMTIGLVPITGIPLPFISYGGSFVLSCCLLQGLVQSVYRFRKDFA
ncbi:MAG: rod shape-determining protein RodA [Opitutaceae bacterium]